LVPRFIRHPIKGRADILDSLITNKKSYRPNILLFINRIINDIYRL